MIDIKETDEFWEEMCKVGFARIGLHIGINGDRMFMVDVAPEEVPGFIESKIERVQQLLGDPLTAQWMFILRFGHWFILGGFYAAFVVWLWS